MSLFKKRKPVVLTEGNALVETIYEICTFLLFTGYFLFYDNRGLQLAFVCIGLGGSALICISKAYESRLKLPLNTIWYSLFFILAEVSAFWAHSPENATSRYLRLMLVLIAVSLGISQYADTTEHCEKLLRIFMFSSVIVSVAQLVFTPVSDWTDRFFGSEVGGNNPNTFGYVVAMGAIISFYFSYIKSKKLYYIFIPVLLMCSVFSSSRKSIGAIIFGIFLIILFSKSKKHRYIHLFLLGIFAIGVLILLFADEKLYRIIGWRFEAMLEYFTKSKVNVDTSLSMREYFIGFAQFLFKEKPIYGQGFANFAILLSTESQINAETYAHNNYWEILADLGLIGFVVYYWFYAVILIKLIIHLFQNKNVMLSTLALAMLISQLILEVGVVSMASFYPQIVMSLIYVCTYASNSQRKFHYSPTKM